MRFYHCTFCIIEAVVDTLCTIEFRKVSGLSSFNNFYNQTTGSILSGGTFYFEPPATLYMFVSRKIVCHLLLYTRYTQCNAMLGESKCHSAVNTAGVNTNNTTGRQYATSSQQFHDNYAAVGSANCTFASRQKVGCINNTPAPYFRRA